METAFITLAIIGAVVLASLLNRRSVQRHGGRAARGGDGYTGGFWSGGGDSFGDGGGSCGDGGGGGGGGCD